MPVVNAEARVGDVALRWPQTIKVFSQYRLDLCCGGGYSLDVAAQKHNLNLDQLLHDLNEAIGA